MNSFLTNVNISLTESTGKTEIEVAVFKGEQPQFSSAKKNSLDRVSPHKTRRNSENECSSRKPKSKAEKKKTKSNHNQLPLPTVQIMQQGSSGNK